MKKGLMSTLTAIGGIAVVVGLLWLVYAGYEGIYDAGYNHARIEASRMSQELSQANNLIAIRDQKIVKMEGRVKADSERVIAAERDASKVEPLTTDLRDEHQAFVSVMLDIRELHQVCEKQGYRANLKSCAIPANWFVDSGMRFMDSRMVIGDRTYDYVREGSGDVVDFVVKDDTTDIQKTFEHLVINPAKARSPGYRNL